MTVKIKLTDEQTKALGEIVADNIGADFQTGFTPDDVPYIYWQMGPNFPVKQARIKEDGTVWFFHPSSVR